MSLLSTVTSTNNSSISHISTFYSRSFNVSIPYIKKVTSRFAVHCGTGSNVCVHLRSSCLFLFSVLLAPCHGCPLLVALEDRLFASSLSARVFQVLGNIQRCRWVCDSEKPSSVECTLTLELTSVRQNTHAYIYNTFHMTVHISAAFRHYIGGHFDLPNTVTSNINNGSIPFRCTSSRPGVVQTGSPPQGSLTRVNVMTSTCSSPAVTDVKCLLGKSLSNPFDIKMILNISKLKNETWDLSSIYSTCTSSTFYHLQPDSQAVTILSYIRILMYLIIGTLCYSKGNILIVNSSTG